MKTTITTICSLILGMLAVTAIAGTTVIAESIRAFARQDVVAVTIISAELNKDGSVTVKFIVTCSKPAHSPTAIVTVVQQSTVKSGFKQESGGATTTGGYPCEHSGTQLRSTVIAATAGLFTGGRATVSVKTFVCDDLGQHCAAGSATKVIHLGDKFPKNS
jgi:hypothetical protein